MANPLIQYGSLNRLQASVTWIENPDLNVTASYLGPEGIRVALDGETTRFLPAMAGAVTSPEPYQMVTLTINLIKSQGLADLYKGQMSVDSRIGDCVVRPDTSALSPYDFFNMAIQGVRELSFNGQDAGYVVVCRGYWPINLDIWA